jgi:hypothetical protein
VDESTVTRDPEPVVPKAAPQAIRNRTVPDWLGDNAKPQKSFEEVDCAYVQPGLMNVYFT